jgi:hypothetical protein
MKNKLKYLLLLHFIFFVSFGYAADVDSLSLEGRWDLTVDVNGKESPSWLEVLHSGHSTWVGRYVAIVGSARPISKITITGNKFSFAIPPQWEQGKGDLTVEGQKDGEGISGIVVYPDGKSYTWKGVRAPSLRTTKKPAWGTPVSLIQENGIKGWHALGENQWVVEKGVLKSAKSGANLVTDEKFKDFKLHVEFKYPKGSNSGIYLRGRYEVQIMDSKGHEPVIGELGAVYGFIIPTEQAAKEAGEWQMYDITLIGRFVTVVLNGKTVITSQEIPGITGGALDSKEGEPGPLQLQGDHGAIEYRNIVITPAK